MKTKSIVPVSRCFLVVALAVSGCGGSKGDPKVGRVTGWQSQLVHQGQTQSAHEHRTPPPLTRRYGRSEPIPAAVRRQVARALHGGDALGLHFAEAQHLSTQAGVSMWLVDGQAVTCLFLETTSAPATACRTKASASRAGITIGTYRTDSHHPGVPTDYLAAGVLPKGKHSMTVKIGPARRTIRPGHGVWAVRANAPITFVSER
jgi:hypothetical protein